MKKDGEVLLYMRERHKGTTQQVAAARAGMSERTARRYERAGKLPSQLKGQRTWRTRENPFEDDWAWVVEQLQRDPALQGATLFALLCAQQAGAVASTSKQSLTRHRVSAGRGASLSLPQMRKALPGISAGSEPSGIRSERVKGLAVMLYLLGLSYGAVSLALDSLGVALSKTCVYETVQAVAARVPGLKREEVFQGLKTKADGVGI